VAPVIPDLELSMSIQKSRPPFFGIKKSALVFYGGIALIIIVGQIVYYSSTTPEQRAKFAERDKEFKAQAPDLKKERAAAEDQKWKEYHFLCDVADACNAYRSAREQCATAGNFDNCVSIKLHKQGSSPPRLCTDEGDLDYSIADRIPVQPVCFFAQMKG
jgi:hypothetical protein